MKPPKITTVNVTPSSTSRFDKTKWLAYQIDGVTIAESHVFMMHGIFTKEKLGRSFFWNHSNLEKMFGEKYNSNLPLFEWKHKDLVYSTGGTLSLKAVKEIIAKITQ